MTEPDASLGGRDTHTLRDDLQAIQNWCIDPTDWDYPFALDQIHRRAIAAMKKLDTAERAGRPGQSLRIWPADDRRLIYDPDPVAGSPGAPRSNT